MVFTKIMYLEQDALRFFKLQYVVATLLNEAYVLKEENYQEMNEFYCCNGKNIEKEVVRETATPSFITIYVERKYYFSI